MRAMQMLEQPSRSGAHYLIPLPDGMQATDAELLSLFTYEIRIGHSGARWSTAQGRFGPARGMSPGTWGRKRSQTDFQRVLY